MITMTPEEIQLIAKVVAEKLQPLIDAALQAERERCAQIAENCAACSECAHRIAHAIRDGSATR